MKGFRFGGRMALVGGLLLAISLEFIIVGASAGSKGMSDSREFPSFSSSSSSYSSQHNNNRHRGAETRREPRSYRSDKDPSKSLSPASSSLAAAAAASATSSAPCCSNNNVVVPPIQTAAASRSLEQHRTSDALFATENSTVITAQIGSTANLPCVVKNLGNGVASWIRRHDYHLLTVGMGTYSNDDRFVVSHNRPMQNWELHVKFVKPSDEGIYECQISTHPPSSIFVKLRVVEAKAEILGEPDKHVKSGSTFELVCVLRDSTEPPVYVFWYHNDRMINYDNERGVVVSSDVEKSILTIQEAQKSDSGNYTCQPSNASPSWIVVHILNGEKPAAMQHGSRSAGVKMQQTSGNYSASSLLFVTSLLYLVLTRWLTGCCCYNGSSCGVNSSMAPISHPTTRNNSKEEEDKEEETKPNYRPSLGTKTKQRKKECPLGSLAPGRHILPCPKEEPSPLLLKQLNDSHVLRRSVNINKYNNNNNSECNSLVARRVSSSCSRVFSLPAAQEEGSRRKRKNKAGSIQIMTLANLNSSFPLLLLLLLLGEQVFSSSSPGNKAQSCSGYQSSPRVISNNNNNTPGNYHNFPSVVSLPFQDSR